MTLETDINLGNITEALNGKIDLPDNVSQSDCHFVVESYVNGTSWYRVYDDGWCEQGGMETTKSQAERSVSFLKTFSNTSYSVLLCYQASDGDLSNGALTTRTKNTGSFTFYPWSADEICWQASGYIGEQS